MTDRLFVAAELPTEAIDFVIGVREEIYTLPARWEPKEKLHITLNFFGDVSRNMIPDIKAKLADIFSERDAFKVEFSRFGMFYFKKNPRILWLGVKQCKELQDIHRKINEEFVMFGFEKDNRKFKPHLTVLRIKGKEDCSMLNKFLSYEIDFPGFKIHSVSLIKSELKPGGSVYQKVESFELK